MKNDRKVVITIDGPAGAGKSTVSRNLAKKLGFVHLNSGALFRSVGLAAKHRGIALTDDAAVTEIAKSLQFSFELSAGGETKFSARGAEGALDIASEFAGELASQIGLLPQLREVLLNVQRDVAKKNPVVTEGRDAGTVVFPDADTKFYLVADFDVRANRRFAELQAKKSASGGQISLTDVKREMSIRDERDSTRAIAPQKQAEDAIRVDTSLLTIEEVVNQLDSILRERGVI